MEHNGMMLRIGMYVAFAYDGKPRYGRIESLGLWGLRIMYAIPENAEGRRVAYRSFNWVDKQTGQPKITNLGVVG